MKIHSYARVLTRALFVFMLLVVPLEGRLKRRDSHQKPTHQASYLCTALAPDTKEQVAKEAKTEKVSVKSAALSPTKSPAPLPPVQISIR